MVIAHGEGAGTGSLPVITLIFNSGGEIIGTIAFNLFLSASISLRVDMNRPKSISYSLKAIF